MRTTYRKYQDNIFGITGIIWTLCHNALTSTSLTNEGTRKDYGFFIEIENMETSSKNKNKFVRSSEKNLMEGSVSVVWQVSDDDINVWRCSMSDSHVTVSPVHAANQSPVSGVIDQWEGRKVSQHVTMVTRYLETSRRSHATEHQRYLQMVKNIFISRPKYLASTCCSGETWDGRPEDWEKHSVGHLARVDS